jgi:hypothetical protein
MRKLVLKKSTLAELSTDELLTVVGGEPTGPQPTPPIYAITYQCTGYYLTIPIDHCLQQG